MGGSARFVHPPTAARSARSWIKERINHGAATLLRSGSGEPGSKRANHATPLCWSTCALFTRPRLASPSEPAQPEEGEGGEESNHLEWMLAQLLPKAATRSEPSGDAA